MIRPGRGLRKPPEHWPVGIPGALGSHVLVLQAKAAAGDGSDPACNGLVIEAGIRYGPVQVLPR